MFSCSRLFAAVLLAIPYVASAEGQFSTVDVVTAGADGEAIVFSLDTVSNIELDDNGDLVVRGLAFSPEVSKVPVTITANPEISDLGLESATQIDSSAGFSQSLSIHSRSTQVDGTEFTRIVAVGRLDNGTPVAITAVDDPSPWLIALFIMSARLTSCYAIPALYECPGGFNLRTEGGVFVTCEFSCMR